MELTRVLSYPKFQLSSDDRCELLAEYLPYGEMVVVKGGCPQVCRDTNDQPVLDLAQSGKPA
jgi:predicted nucleic acid-binding protein